MRTLPKTLKMLLYCTSHELKQRGRNSWKRHEKQASDRNPLRLDPWLNYRFEPLCLFFCDMNHRKKVDCIVLPLEYAAAVIS